MLVTVSELSVKLVEQRKHARSRSMEKPVQIEVKNRERQMGEMVADVGTEAVAPMRNTIIPHPKPEA
jgi:hypothetical protein